MDELRLAALLCTRLCHDPVVCGARRKADLVDAVGLRHALDIAAVPDENVIAGGGFALARKDRIASARSLTKSTSEPRSSLPSLG